jgi:hypothetical protein
MKKSVLNAAMLLVLGVSGVANAVQMHGVIQGTLAGSDSYDYPSKTWGANSVPQNGQAVQIDVWFDSGLIPSYDASDNAHIFDNSRVPNKFMTLSATYNGVTRTLSSTTGWNLQDYWIGTGNSKDMVVMDVYESLGGYQAIRRADLYLAFADNSIPVLREAMLGHTVGTVSLGAASQLSKFYYQGQVGDKTYDSRLSFTPTSFAIAPVPEPETWAMMLLGLGVVGYAARRRASR